MSASPPSSISRDCRVRLADRLQDQIIRVPNLLKIYGQRTVRENSTVDPKLLRSYLEEERFERYIPTETQRSKQRRFNIAYCASLFYADVSAEKLRPLAQLLAWLCFWDDEVDNEMIAEDHERIQAYCTDSIAFIRWCFQPECGTNQPAIGRPHNCGVFVDIANTMKLDQSLEDRDRFVQALVDFIDGTGEAAARSSSDLPAVDEYIQRRLDTVGFGFIFHSLNWAYNLSIPTSIWEHEAMRSLIYEALTGVWLANDNISLRKEIKNEEYHSIIPILMYHEGLSVQKAVDQAVGMMSRSYKAFKAAAEVLRHVVANQDESVNRDVEIWIEAITDVLIGNVVFHLHSPRYLPREAFENDSNGFRVTL
jgi:hypothetical protein